jgi:hypothetical protein
MQFPSIYNPNPVKGDVLNNNLELDSNYRILQHDGTRIRKAKLKMKQFMLVQ